MFILEYLSNVGVAISDATVGVVINFGNVLSTILGG